MVYATCAQPFTRRASATRHDDNKHNGQGEIVPLLEYVVGRGTGRFIPGAYIVLTPPKMADLAHNSNRGFGVATVAEIGSCQETALKKHLGVMSTNTHYSTAPKVGLAHTDHQLRAQENVLKLEELKRLAINIRNTSGILMEF